MSLRMVCLLIITSISTSAAWDLSPLSTAGGGKGVVLSHVTLCGLRAFLSIDRRDVSEHYTLLETTWPEVPKPLPTLLKPFPLTVPQTVGNCSMVQSAVSSAWDNFRYLFVLDAGWLHFCPPKILIYDLYTNKLVASKEIPASGAGLKQLLVDANQGFGTKVYISDSHSVGLIVFDILSQKMRKVSLKPSLDEDPFSSQNIVLPSIFQMTLAGSTLFFASHLSDDLFKADISHLRNESYFLAGGAAKERVLQIVRIGSLLGPTQGLLADSGRGALGKPTLYYCLPRDLACVSWDMTLPLQAESHKVLLQSSDLLPHVHQLFMDPQRQLWALTDPRHSTGTHCVHIQRTQ